MFFMDWMLNIKGIFAKCKILWSKEFCYWTYRVLLFLTAVVLLNTSLQLLSPQRMDPLIFTKAAGVPILASDDTIHINRIKPQTQKPWRATWYHSHFSSPCGLVYIYIFYVDLLKFVMFYSHISRDPSINETFCLINLQQKYRKTPIKHFKCTVIILPNIFPTRDAHTQTNDDDTYDNYIQSWQRWRRRWWWWWWWCYHPFQHTILSHPFTSFYRRTPWPRPQCLLPRRHLWQTLKPNDPPA